MKHNNDAGNKIFIQGLYWRSKREKSLLDDKEQTIEEASPFTKQCMIPSLNLKWPMNVGLKGKKVSHGMSGRIILLLIREGYFFKWNLYYYQYIIEKLFVRRAIHSSLLQEQLIAF